MRQRGKKRKTSIGCLFWITLLLLVLVLFALNKNSIQRAIINTGLCKYLPFLPTCKDEEPDVNVEVKKEDQADSENNMDNTSQPAVTGDPAAAEESEVFPASVPETRTAPDPERKIRKSILYFVQYTEDGSIILKGVERSVYFTNSPLTDTIQTLFKGLNVSELNLGFLSMIPEGVSINSVIVRDKIAYLDLSEEFLYNTFGREGYSYQLQQLVYTATEFPTVEKVQILITGKVREYLSPEGIYIGKPVGRGDFSG